VGHTIDCALGLTGHNLGQHILMGNQLAEKPLKAEV
jgi:hypothetical protein